MNLKIERLVKKLSYLTICIVNSCKYLKCKEIIQILGYETYQILLVTDMRNYKDMHENLEKKMCQLP